MLKDFFIKQSIKSVEVEKFLREYFPIGDYSKIELQRTPLGIKIIIWTNKPGKIIGKGGKTISDMTEALKEQFKLENPQLDVKVIENPDLDARIVAKQIASALEKGYNYKKIGNLAVRKVMDAGAAGVEIVISGKLGGAKAMSSKFIEGHIEMSGYPQKQFVDSAFEEANTKPGKIGVLVRIMKKYELITGQIVEPGKSENINKEGDK
jgi:small subunit ribosomal protein S3